MALGVVVLALAKAIVDKKGGAALQAPGHGADKGLRLRLDFSEVVVIASNVDGRAQCGRTVLPHKAEAAAACHIVLHGHAALVPNARPAVQQLHRHGVQHFVADDDALQGRRQGIGPTHQRTEAGQPLLLALAQAGRDFHNGVLPQRLPCRGRGERIQQLFGQRAAACTKLPHGIGAGVAQGVLHLHGQGLAKQGA